MVSFIFCNVHPTWGNDPIWRLHIFQLGWFNHQLEYSEDADLQTKLPTTGTGSCWPAVMALFCYVLCGSWFQTPHNATWEVKLNMHILCIYIYILYFTNNIFICTHIYMYTYVVLWTDLSFWIYSIKYLINAVKDSVGSMHELCFLVCSESLSHWLNLALPQNNHKQPWIIFATGRF